MLDIEQFVKTYIPYDWKPTSGGWISGNCPMCVINGEGRPDKKRRGGVLFETSNVRYHCFNCGYVASWSYDQQIPSNFRKLLEILGADPSDIQRFSLQLKKYDHLLTNKPQTPIINNVMKITNDWKELPLPPKSKKLYEITNVSNSDIEKIEYIIGRQLDFYNNWYVSDDFKFKNRIILPLTYKNKIVGYSARAINTGNTYAKYLTTQPTNYVFNLDRQNNSKKYVIVSEGYFDALLTDGVAIGSNYISDEQAQIIESLNKEIIVIPDANKASYRFIMSAIDRGWCVSFPPWEKEITDVNDSVKKYGRYFTIYSILEFSIKNSIKAQVKAKTWI